VFRCLLTPFSGMLFREHSVWYKGWLMIGDIKQDSNDNALRKFLSFKLELSEKILPASLNVMRIWHQFLS